MVIDKIKNMFSRTDEKYEILYYKYSKLRLDNNKLKKKHTEAMAEHKAKIHYNMAKHLINLYQNVENVRNDSFKIKANDKETQMMLIDINKLDKNIRKVMGDFTIENYGAKERMYDPEIHDVASYQDAQGMAKGIIINTVKRGFKYKNKVIIKPKVLVTK